MSDEPEPQDQPSLTRRGIETVIGRAVELSLQERDADDQISEEELVRIAEELGLAPRHVRQALYEQPVEEPEGFLDRHFGRANITVTRSVPVDPSTAHRRLEEYLVTREYLQLRRRQGANAYFEPADDAISSIARTFSRSSSRYQLARAQKAYLTVRSLEPGWSHVRLELSFPEKRRNDVTMATALVVILGGMGATIAGAVGVGLGSLAGEAGMVIGGIAGGTVGFGGAVTAVFTGFRASFQRWRGRAREEADALLDRLEQGETLQPPASPWMRRLQQKLRTFPRP